MKKLTNIYGVSILFGVLVGNVIAFYLWAINKADYFRQEYQYFILLLPVIGLLYLYLYHRYQVFAHKRRRLSTKEASQNIGLLTSGTVLSHLAGASIGREGVAALLAQNVGGYLGDYLDLDKQKQNALYIASMSAGLVGTFGSALAALALYLEIVPAKFRHFETTMTVLITIALTKVTMALWHINYLYFPIAEINFQNIWQFAYGLLLILGASYLLSHCYLLGIKYYRKLFKKATTTMIVSNILIFILLAVLQTTAYLGISLEMQQQALTGKIIMLAFLWKFLFTVISIGGGYQGGLITPIIDISLACGASLSHFTAFDASIVAVLMFVGTFAAISQAPLTTVCLTIAFFGWHNLITVTLLALVASKISALPSIFSFKHLEKLNSGIMN